MKYRQLTKEQFESLHEEFARFLALQSIDAKEWKQLKEEKPHIAAEEMNIFSDVVWDDVLTKTAYLEHFSESSINLFKSDMEEIHRIVINVENKKANLLTQEGFEWLLKNATDESVAFFKGTKKYPDERNLEIFDLIEKGSQIAKGAIFEHFNRLIS
ncbi:DUF6495 family protein [Tenacibaculum maritimum]|uniref:DUF6495 family protein n=1 Tax=Tenacibaculum maritimum TaxID=107401 RepID=UPI0012E6B6C2|nr:DUF6495 family protein [Tenacibaculum maritimum]MCD9581817.1 DUF6495 family protein [Tenacibaculum maritimum]MCD9635636.1 DUF6495 family protein [Tenacibaculum maritimum]CAA0167737.1 conserved hypothetical protein [Tenacibaculum maritimum]CAA0186634.1 conserved hypothetical protein [Tenacibaculum maritimum]CAA0198462.1 conserved hypothetical protein [Tenacibaculum maritimum]